MVQAHLSGGQWLELLAPEHPGIAEVKWCRNRFRPFLCIAPHVKPPSPLSCREINSIRAMQRSFWVVPSGRLRMPGVITNIFTTRFSCKKARYALQTSCT